MTLRERLTELIQACFTGLWIESHEHEDALREMAQLCRDQDWRLATWNLETGLTIPGAETTPTHHGPRSAGCAAFAHQPGERIPDELAGPRKLPSVLAIHRSRPSLDPTDPTRQAAPDVCGDLGSRGQHPGRTRKTVHCRRTRPAEPRAVGRDRAGRSPPNQANSRAVRDWETVLDAAAGLTRYEAEGAFSLSLVRHDRLQAEAVWSIKEGLLKKSGLLQLYRGQETFDSLGGLHSLKAFCRRALLQSQPVASRPRPRGLLLVSPPGCGKSQFCKASGP